MAYLLRLLVCLTLLVPTVATAGLPEFGFCPLGGPTGWLNRLTGQHKKRVYYYPPPAYMQGVLYQRVPYYSPAPTQTYTQPGQLFSGQSIR